MKLRLSLVGLAIHFWSGLASADPLGLVDYEALLATDGEIVSEGMMDNGDRRVELQDGTILFISPNGRIGGVSPGLNEAGIGCIVENLVFMVAVVDVIESELPNREIENLRILAAHALFDYAGRVRPNVVSYDDAIAAFNDRVATKVQQLRDDLERYGLEDGETEEFLNRWSLWFGAAHFESTLNSLQRALSESSLPTGTCGPPIYDN